MSSRDTELVAQCIRYFADPTVVEYGAGWSTVFFAPIAKKYITLETHDAWADAIRQNLPSNVTMYRCSEDVHPMTYASIPFEDISSTPVEVAIVDGRHRKDVIKYLHANSLARIVLLHDAHRGSKEMEVFTYRFKVGDDFFIGINDPRLRENLDELLQAFDARPMDWPSVPWDPSHTGPAFSVDGRHKLS